MSYSIEIASSKKHVLIIDDDVDYAKQLSFYLEGHNLKTTIETDSTAALRRIREDQPDIVILEVDLRSESGLTICKLSRKEFRGGIIMMSHRTDELDEVLGLDMGADDYISRNASHRLVFARIKSLLKCLDRSEVNEASVNDKRLIFDNLIIDHTMREAWLDREPIDLTSAEFDLLWLLSSHAGEVLSREEIFSQLRGIEYDGQDRSVDVRVSRIRPKVGDDPNHPRRIKTVRSKGYLFVGPVSSKNN